MVTGINTPNTPTISDSDEALAEALQDANRDALSILYDRYAPVLYGVFQKITGDNAIAEDALQLCFINIWKLKNGYNSSEETVFTWVFKIAKDAADAVIRKKGILENQTDSLFVNHDTLKYKEVKNSTIITELIIFGGISQEEAAEKLGVSIMELRQIIRKEINKLRGF
jgi:Sigma-70 region 2